MELNIPRSWLEKANGEYSGITSVGGLVTRLGDEDDIARMAAELDAIRYQAALDAAANEVLPPEPPEPHQPRGELTPGIHWDLRDGVLQSTCVRFRVCEGFGEFVATDRKTKVTFYGSQDDCCDWCERRA